ncbi:TetR/AcrR family transcriptional regulator [Tistrella mobilis]
MGETGAARQSHGYHHGDLKPVLIAAARRLVEADGHDRLSLREVARQAGVSAMAPYRHVENREALLAELAAQGFRELGAALKAAADQGVDPRSRSLAQAQAYVGFACANPGLFRLMVGPLDPAQKQLIAADAEAAHAMGATPDIDPDLARARWALVHGLSMLIIDGRLAIAPGDTVPAIVARTVAALWPEGGTGEGWVGQGGAGQSA